MEDHNRQLCSRFPHCRGRGKRARRFVVLVHFRDVPMTFVLSRRSSRALSLLLIAFATSVCCGAAAHADVAISGSKTKNITCSAGVCSPTAPKAVLNVTDLANMLAAGDVAVKADSAALDIRFAAPLSWTTTSRLTLDAYRSIFFEQPVVVAGVGAMTITTNDGGAGGDYSFEGEGHVEFWDLNSSLIIAGHRFKLANTLAQLADGASKKRGAGYVALAKSYDALDDGAYKKPLVKYFSGTLEGLGNHLDNFSLKFRKATEFFHFVGLIGEVEAPGIVRDLALRNASITCVIADDFVGAIAGRNYGTVRGVAVTGTVQGSTNSFVNDEVGGLVGDSLGSIINSRSDATVSNGAWTGGLVGVLRSEGPVSIVISSHATGAVSSRGNAGGLAAAASGSNTSIDQSSALGNVDSLLASPNIGTAVGALVGDSQAAISNSYATGSATTGGASSAAGGLLGFSSGPVVNAYSTGAVTSSDCSYCGGLIGGNSGQVTASYSTGMIDASGGSVGGLIGADSATPGSLSATYWDLDTSGIGDPAKGAGNIQNDPGITGLIDETLKSELPTGFDPQVWAQKKNINGGYPFLRANPPPK